MRRIALLLLCAAPFAAAVASDDFAWLSGDWRRCQGGEVIEERWLGPWGDVLVGVNLTTSPRSAPFFESLRIARDGDGWVYWAATGGRPAVPFRLVESAPQRAVFANPERAFPARISYWRDGADLLARVEGSRAGQPAAEEWRFTSGTAADCRAPA